MPPVSKPAVPVEVHALLHPSGARSYVVVDPDTREALVVDPTLDEVGEVKRILGARGATLVHIVETHTHGDHLSGASVLHRDTGAEVVMSLAADSRVATRRVGEGDVLTLGEQVLKVRLAPGVAPDALVLEGPRVLFTGDTLLVGTIGLRDAPGADGVALYDTIQRVFEPQADDTTVHPGHDDMGRSRTTIYAEKRGNRWMREKDRDNFLLRFAADPRPQARNADEILAANREGLSDGVRVEAPSASDADAGAAPKGPVVAPPGMGAARTGGLVPEGLVTLLTLGALLVVVGCALGFLVSRWFHLLSGAVGAAAVVVGLVSSARRPKKKDPGLYYLGPLPRTPMR
jgi:glyoxylase-like metal-dependent hydrolase (beta-lactamase superfamily II)